MKQKGKPVEKALIPHLPYCCYPAKRIVILSQIHCQIIMSCENDKPLHNTPALGTIKPVCKFCSFLRHYRS